MPHPDNYDYYVSSCCPDVSRTLGFQKMPDGYSLMLDADLMFYFWIERATGRESTCNKDRWAVYRGAKADAEKRNARSQDNDRAR